MPEDKIHQVNVGRVAKNVQSIGQFGLFQVEGINLVTTQWFMLSVTEEQFWKIQCKLEAKQTNIWLYKSKDGLHECTGPNAEQSFELYCNQIYTRTEQLKRTSLTLGGIELFTDEQKYIGLSRKHLDMIEFAPVVRKGVNKENVVVDDVHVFTTVCEENIESQYLRLLNA